MKILSLLLFIPFLSFSQNNAEKIFDNATTSPTYVGGVDAMREFIVKNFNYPEKDYRRGKQGVIWVEFVVTKTGEITEVSILKGVSKRLNKECLRMVCLMPNWIPGQENNQNVNVRYVIPIRAKLGDAYEKTKKVKFK